jgi:2-dehydro-3-deoxyphosphooctonate aldolase (KDO 8-P synthase)
MAVGVDGLFLEVHPDPDRAISDGPNQVRLDSLKSILQQAAALDKLVKNDLLALS